MADNYSVTESFASPKRAYPIVTVYLPPGPVFKRQNTPTGADVKNSVSHNDTDSFYIQHHIAASTSSTVVTIQYRLGTIEPPEEQLPDVESPKDDGNGTAKSAVAKSNENKSPRRVHYDYQNAVHDTLTAFDWIQKTFQPSQLNVLGSHVGGSLAMMLALTESQSIHAVAAVEPICDWTGLDQWCEIAEYLTTGPEPTLEGIEGSMADLELSENKKQEKRWRSKSRSIAPPDLVPLLEARESLFAKPERYFDPFASPILFVRTPGRAIPAKFPQYLTGPDKPVPVLKERIVLDIMSLGLAEDEDILPGEPLSEDLDDESFIHYDTEASSIYIVSDHTGRRYNVEIPMYRKTLLRWPPYGLDYGLSGATWFQPHLLELKRLDMTLPWVHIFVRQHESKRSRTVLSEQAKDMQNIMQKACLWVDRGDKEFREKGVGLSKIPSDETWPASAGMEKAAGEWLESVRDWSHKIKKERKIDSELAKF